MLQIGGRTFSTKAAVERHIREIFSRYANATDTEPLYGADLEFARALAARHQHVKCITGPGIREIHIQRLPFTGYKRFLLVRVDGSRWDMAWRYCLTQRSQRQDVTAICRTLVEPQILAFRDRFWGEHVPPVPCPILGLPMAPGTCHVDHAEPTFAELVDGWLRVDVLDVENIEIVRKSSYGERNKFADPLLSHSWVEYHRINARLRMVSKQANLSTLRRRAA